MPVLSIDERIALLRPMPARDAVRQAWLTPELLATDAARARLARWVDAGFPEASNPATWGPEPRLQRLVDQAVERLPPCVRWHLAQHAVFVLVGGSTQAWTGAWPRHDWAAIEPVRLVAVSGHGRDDDDMLGTIAHEAGHCWLEDTPLVTRTTQQLSNRPAPLTDEERADAGMQTQHALLLGMVREQERRAARLARQWGFTGPATDVARCAAVATLPGEEDDDE